MDIIACFGFYQTKVTAQCCVGEQDQNKNIEKVV